MSRRLKCQEYHSGITEEGESEEEDREEGEQLDEGSAADGGGGEDDGAMERSGCMEVDETSLLGSVRFTSIMNRGHSCEDDEQVITPFFMQIEDRHSL